MILSYLFLCNLQLQAKFQGFKGSLLIFKGYFKQINGKMSFEAEKLYLYNIYLMRKGCKVEGISTGP